MNTKRKADAVMDPKINRFMRMVMAEACGQIITDTPVKTGRAAGNWNATVDRPEYTDDKLDPGQSDTIRRAQGVAQRVRFAQGQVGFLANGVPYITYLENGTPKMAPYKMVALTMVRMRDFIRRNARRFGV